MPLHLHIFEERYKSMMQSVLEGDRTFGVLLIRLGEEASGPIAETYSIGCSARIIRVQTQPDGKMNLMAIGEERFLVAEYDRQQAYLQGRIGVFPFLALDELRESQSVSLRLRKLIQSYLVRSDLAEQLEPGITADQIQLPQDPYHLLMAACYLLQIPAYEKQALLEIESSDALLRTAMRLYRREAAISGEVLLTGEASDHGPIQLN